MTPAKHTPLARVTAPALTLALLGTLTPALTTPWPLAPHATAQEAHQDYAHDIVTRPYDDNLGLIPRSELADSQARSMTALVARSRGTDASTLSALNDLSRTLDYVDEHITELASTELHLSQIGSANDDQKRTHQYFAFDNRDLTGLSIDPSNPNLVVEEKNNRRLAHIDVFVNADAATSTDSPIVLSWRQIGRADGPKNNGVVLKRTQLAPGYNNVSIDITDYTQPIALYVHNNSTQPASVRIAAADITNSPTTEAAAPSQQPSAAPVALGNSLNTYPTYIHDPSNPEAFADYLAHARAHTGPNMTDLRFGTQDISAPLAEVLKTFQDIPTGDRAAAAEAATTAYETVTTRLALQHRFEGFDETAAWPDPQAPSPHHVVTLHDNDVKKPSPMYAWYEHYHMPANNLSFLRGNTDVMYNWAHSHEYGHMLDNRQVAIPETTNNIYSTHAALERYRYRLEQGRDGQPLGKVAHPALPGAQKTIDAWLKERITDPTIDPAASPSHGSFDAATAKKNVFLRVTNLSAPLEFFSHYDYSTYDYANSPFTPALAQEVADYGVYGVALRHLRQDGPWPTAIHRGGSPTDKLNRFVLMTAYGSGFNTCDFFTARGFTGLSEQTKQFCAQYPALPVKLEYHRLEQELTRLRAEAGQGPESFGREATARITPTQRGAGWRFTVTVDNANPDAADVYELYHRGELVAMNRTGVFDVETAGPADDYSAIAYDYLLTPSAPSASHPDQPTKEEPGNTGEDAADKPTIVDTPDTTDTTPVDDQPGAAEEDSTTGDVEPPVVETPSSTPAPVPTPAVTTTAATTTAGTTTSTPTRNTTPTVTTPRPTPVPRPTRTTTVPAPVAPTVTAEPAPTNAPAQPAPPVTRPAPRRPMTFWERVTYGFQRLFFSPRSWTFSRW